MVFAVVLDLVSTPHAHVLVPVLVRLVSPVVLVLDEIAVVLDPFLIAVFCDCDEDCGGNGCLGTPCLERSSGSSPPIFISISRISRSAGDAIRSCSCASVSTSDIV